jgi:hypothetical protein
METNKINRAGLVAFDRFLLDALEKMSQGWMEAGMIQSVVAATATIDKHTVVIDCTGAVAKTITIPDAETCPGKYYFFQASVAAGTALQDTTGNAIIADIETTGAAFVISNGAPASVSGAGWTTIPIMN